MLSSTPASGRAFDAGVTIDPIHSGGAQWTQLALLAGGFWRRSAHSCPRAGAQASEDRWQSAATLYLWFPGISGRTQFPSGAGGPTINVNAKDVLSKPRHGVHGNDRVAPRAAGAAWSDWVYSDLSGDALEDARPDRRRRGRCRSAHPRDLGLRVKTNVLTLAGTYAAGRSRRRMSPPSSADVRMLKTDQTLNWSIVGHGPGRVGLAASGVSRRRHDQLGRHRGRARARAASGAEPRWFLPYHVDIGTGASRHDMAGGRRRRLRVRLRRRRPGRGATSTTRSSRRKPLQTPHVQRACARRHLPLLAPQDTTLE